MHKKVKKIRKAILATFVLMMMVSFTVFAENDEKVNIQDDGYEVFLDFEKSGSVYTGEEIKPDVAVAKTDENGEIIEGTTLTENDYTVEFSNNTDAGNATVIVTGQDSYEGTIETTFTIEKVSLDKATISLSKKAYAYDGKAKKPTVTLKFNDKKVAADNYKITYTNNVNAGKATVKVTAKAASKNYNGAKNATFTINAVSLKNAKITLSNTSYTYNGNAKKPVPTVKINGVVIGKKVNGTQNYSVSYSNNKNIGTASVKIAAKGKNLTGSKTVTFKIRPKSTTITLERAYKQVEITWKKVTKASGYEVWRSTKKDSGYTRIKNVTSGSTVSYTDKAAKHNVKYYYKVRAYKTVNGTKVYGEYSPAKYITVRVAKAKITNISRVTYTSLNIKWDAVEGATGYRVYRCKTKDGKYLSVATLKGNDSLSYTDKDLKCGRVYYYKVCAYREVDDTKYFGTYSSYKSKNTCPAKATLLDDCFYMATKTTLEWTKPSGAEGYEIYRSTAKNGTYTKVKTIKSADTLKWTNTGLAKEKNYFYKIRAYCKVDGKTVYGAYSNIFQKKKGGWRYSTFEGKKIKYYYNADNERVTDVSNLIGKQDSYVIKVNKQRATVTVYAKDGDNGYIIPVKAFVCSPGWSTPVGSFNTQQKLRWHELMGPCWGQWNTRISGSYLFHSVFYNSYRNSDALSVSAYNKLGTVCSHGCVRLTAGDAKWIYDNCDLGTQVIIYNSSTSGPFGKPSAVTLPYWHTWDPTDPNKFDKCDEHGCH